MNGKENIKKWNIELVNTIKMVAYGKPIIEHFATHSHKAEGYTLLQMIETSNIAAHFSENTGQAYIDVFSCKAFENDDVIQVCQKYFKPVEVNKITLQRGLFKNDIISIDSDSYGKAA